MSDYKQLDLISGFCDTNDYSPLECSLSGLWMRTPIMTASGTFGYGHEYTALDGFNVEDVGAIVLKSITLNPKLGNPEPRIVETPAGLINSIGLTNVGIHQLIAEKLPAIRHFRTNVIVSIAANSIEEYGQVAKILSQSSDYEAVEVNISCPNVHKGGMLFSFDPNTAAAVTSVVKNQIDNKPIIMKLSPNAPDITSTAVACIYAGADAVSLVNTFTALAIDIDSRRPILKRNFGGLSGPAIRPLALALVAKVALKFKELGISKPIIGIGGIQTYKDALEFILAGATAVGVGTSMFYKPSTISEIKTGLISYCRKYGTSIRELVGSLIMHDDIDC